MSNAIAVPISVESPHIMSSMALYSHISNTKLSLVMLSRSISNQYPQ